MGIKDVDTSSTLSNKSSALSFNQKVDMLIDIGAISKTNKVKFLTFMEILSKILLVIFSVFLSISCEKELNPGGEPPVAAFSANKTSLIEGESVQFTDQSTNEPTGWVSRLMCGF